MKEAKEMEVETTMNNDEEQKSPESQEQVPKENSSDNFTQPQLATQEKIDSNFKHMANMSNINFDDDEKEVKSNEDTTISSVNNNSNNILTAATRPAEAKQIEYIDEYALKMLNKMEKNNGNIPKSVLLNLWFIDVWKKRKCYFPLLTHIIDQMTDVGVIIAFALLYLKEEKSSHGRSYCEPINPLYLLILSLFSFWFYRIASAFAIYNQTKSVTRIILQLLDLELFRALLINYKLNTLTPSNPQRWIQSLEAVFEAFPQTLIQLFFVTKTNSLDSLVLFSIIWSLWSIVSKTCNEDEILFSKKYQKSQSKCLSKTSWSNCQCISQFYIFRIVYRAGDVIVRVLILLSVWIFIGGLLFFIVLLIEFIVLTIISVVIKELSSLAHLCIYVLF